MFPGIGDIRVVPTAAPDGGQPSREHVLLPLASAPAQRNRRGDGCCRPCRTSLQRPSRLLRRGHRRTGAVAIHHQRIAVGPDNLNWQGGVAGPSAIFADLQALLGPLNPALSDQPTAFRYLHQRQKEQLV